MVEIEEEDIRSLDMTRYGVYTGTSHRKGNSKEWNMLRARGHGTRHSPIGFSEALDINHAAYDFVSCI